MKKILHIAAHMGGGAGKAISGILKNSINLKNTLLLLEEPDCQKYIDICKKSNIEIIITSNIEKIAEIVQENEVIVLNWWGHPLFVNVFKALNKVKCRTILWSHINGLYYPYLLYDFIKKFDISIYTSPCTYENQYWTKHEKEYIQEHSIIVYGMGEFIPQKIKYKSDYHIKEEFKIGYTGTLSFNKINPEFPKICTDTYHKINNASFELYGKYNDDIKKYFSCKAVNFKGYSDDIESVLTEFDIFCYPLVEKNFATTENSLIEAMAAALPVIVLNNPAERNIVTHYKTGLIAQTPNEVTEYIKLLYDNIDLRENLGKNAREYVCQNYSYKKNVINYENVIKDVMNSEKTKHDFSDILGSSAWSFFKYFSGNDFDSIQKILNGNKNIILPEIYYDKSKGSPEHFYHYFNDEINFKKIIKK